MSDLQNKKHSYKNQFREHQRKCIIYINPQINVLPNCKTHNKSCNVYCSKCDQIMCDLCFLQEHKGHFSQDEGVKKFITIKNEYDKTISQIQKINRTIEEKKNDIITKINKYADERKVELNEFIKNEKNEKK